MPIRWYIVKREDNNTVHDLPCGDGGSITTMFFGADRRAANVVIRVVGKDDVHDKIVKDELGTALSPLHKDEKDEQTFLATNYQDIDSELKREVDSKLSALSVSATGTTVKQKIQSILNTSKWIA